MKLPHYEVRQFFVGKKDIDTIIYQTYLSMRQQGLKPKYLVMSKETVQNLAVIFESLFNPTHESKRTEVSSYLDMEIHKVEDLKEGEIWLMTQKGWDLL